MVCIVAPRLPHASSSVVPACNHESMPITDADRELLRIAATPYRHEGIKSDEMSRVSGLSIVQAWQRVNILVDSEGALAAEPVYVNRLRRIRAERLRSRSLRSA